MPAYWIAHTEVTDAESYGQYANLAGPAIEAHGGRFLARGGRHVQLEGNDRARNVVVVFPSLEDAEACYRSPAYQEALAFAKGASIRDLVARRGRLIPPTAARAASARPHACESGRGQGRRSRGRWRPFTLDAGPTRTPTMERAP